MTNLRVRWVCKANKATSWDMMKTSWEKEFSGELYKDLFVNSKTMFNKSCSLNQSYEEIII